MIMDFEASSLSDESYPIEIGWCDGDGKIHSFLINPDYGDNWIDWDPKSESIHNISRELLKEKGVESRLICEKLEHEFNGQTFYFDAPVWDLKWLQKLYSSYKSPSIRIQDFKRLNCIALMDSKKLKKIRAKIRHKMPQRHRAELDVRYLLEVYKECWSKI